MRMWSSIMFYFIHTVVTDMGRSGGRYLAGIHAGLAIGVRVHLGWSIVTRTGAPVAMHDKRCFEHVSSLNKTMHALTFFMQQ